MNKICNKSSEELQNYYVKGVIDKVDGEINKDKNDNNETPEYRGVEYEDPNFEEETIRLMKTGKYKSIEAAEHQALQIL